MMKKYKNKKGFTLIELIVVIGIVAALSVTMGISFVNTLNETQVKQYRETYDDIFDAAKLYAKLKVLPENCEETATPDVSCGNDGLIIEESEIVGGELPAGKGKPICCLVESGLLDDDVFGTADPTRDDGKKFDYGKTFWIIKNSGGEYIAAMKNDACGSKEYVFSDRLKDYGKWQGDCTNEG